MVMDGNIFPHFRAQNCIPKAHRIRVLHSCYLHVLWQGVEMVIEILHKDLVAP